MNAKNNRILLSIFLSLCFSVIEAQQNDSVKVEIKNTGKVINSTFSDGAPVISADGSVMMFTSRRPVSEKEIKKQKESMEHVYMSEYNKTTKKWSAPKLLPEDINVEGRNNSAIALSNDGQKLLLYRDDENGNGDIWESELNGTAWSEPVKLPDPINSKYQETSASLSPDGRTIYFVSNRPGGKGGLDIWYCKQDSAGHWGMAINIGAPINTKQDEEGVFIHPDGKTLYFSSKGHGGLGGYDIFKSVYENGKWSEPVNLGAPINTKGDDVFFVMEANGETGYYASKMAGGIGDYDIYKISFIPVKKKNTGPKLTLIQGMVVDDETSQPIEASIITTDNEKNTELAKVKSNSSTGKFLISLPSGKNYGISANAPGYLFYSDNFNIPDTAAYKEVVLTIRLKKLQVGKQIVLHNIFYDFDKATLRSESLSEMERLVALMNENPSMKVEISSYTDNKGSQAYNLNLSQARAQSVVNYLINKGISKDRLVAKGYGMANPIASNDTDDGRQMNRRTEFKILSN